MARICDICDKRPVVVNNVSHAKNRTKRWAYPNVQKMRYTITSNPTKSIKRGPVCTKCLKAGKVHKIV